MDAFTAEILPKLRRGDIIVVHHAERMPTDQHAALRDTLKRHVEANSLSPITIIPLRHGMELSVLDEEAMRKCGWVRAAASLDETPASTEA
jgi:hypothetical protein